MSLVQLNAYIAYVNKSKTRYSITIGMSPDDYTAATYSPKSCAQLEQGFGLVRKGLARLLLNVYLIDRQDRYSAGEVIEIEL